MMRKTAVLLACLSFGAFAASASAQAASSSRNGTQATTIHVPANQQWVSTGITVQSGEVLLITSNGEVKLSADPLDTAQPAGRREHRLGPRASLPGQWGGALVARVGNGPAFAIGDETSVTMSASGLLYLGVDDDLLTDNSGEYTVSITPAPRGTAGTSGSGEQTIHVPANQQWTATGLTVRAGETVSFRSSGQVKLSTDPSDVAQPGGRAEHRLGPTASLPGQPGGELVARVGNGTPFPVGNQSSVRMPASGELYLGVDDDGFADNSGEFLVVITPQATAGMPAPRL